MEELVIQVLANVRRGTREQAVKLISTNVQQAGPTLPIVMRMLRVRIRLQVLSPVRVITVLLGMEKLALRVCVLMVGTNASTEEHVTHTPNPLRVPVWRVTQETSVRLTSTNVKQPVMTLTSAIRMLRVRIRPQVPTPARVMKVLLGMEKLAPRACVLLVETNASTEEHVSQAPPPPPVPVRRVTQEIPVRTMEIQ
ncbi:uncharacterized protein LOC124114884 [Haliotis rufescens]|uniref:uncharacterized protein LOC124114884 n=1 Tax=Haliotis rufescens TaxID=6454 RepID=UPI00201E9638|nr:uncharacterized protein LOC124114884 [Haliotis rufescens]